MNDLRRLVLAFDEEALAALASRGLLRRAGKDLASGPRPTSVEEEEAVRVQLAEQEVTIPAAGPAHATCTCPASDCCRHVVAAVLFLRQQWEPAKETEADAGDEGSEKSTDEDGNRLRDELLAIPYAEIAAWAGKKATAEAMRWLAAHAGAPSIELGTSVRVRMPDCECHFLPAAGLAGALTSGPAKEHRRWVAAALLAFQRHHGMTHVAPSTTTASLPAARGAPRSRAQVLASTRSLLEEIVDIGLSHVSPSVVQRLRTLAVSASGVHLPRLALALRGTADEAGRLLARTAQGDEERLLATAARGYALVVALERALAVDGDRTPTSHLVGRHRTQYDDVGSLDLAGLGAYGWRTRSGFRGLTLLFVDVRSQRWYTWSDSRPQNVDPGFDPKRRYLEAATWSGAGTPARTSRHRIRLFGAKTNAEGRLSASRACRADVLGPTVLDEIDLGALHYRSWQELRRHAARNVPVGLQVRNPLSNLVVVSPAAWGRSRYDELEQALAIDLYDSSGESLPLRVGYSPLHEPVLQRLEQIDAAAAGVWGLTARVDSRRTGLCLYPISLLLERPTEGRERVLNLTLDPPPRRSRISRWLDRLRSARSASDGEVADETPLPAWSAATERVVAELEDALQHRAETGRRATPPGLHERLAASAESLRNQGLHLLAAVAEQLAADGQGGPLALRARYLCDLHREHAVRAAIEAPPPHTP